MTLSTRVVISSTLSPPGQLRQRYHVFYRERNQLPEIRHDRRSNPPIKPNLPPWLQLENLLRFQTFKFTIIPLSNIFCSLYYRSPSTTFCNFSTVFTEQQLECFVCTLTRRDEYTLHIRWIDESCMTLRGVALTSKKRSKVEIPAMSVIARVYCADRRTAFTNDLVSLALNNFDAILR